VRLLVENALALGDWKMPSAISITALWIKCLHLQSLMTMEPRRHELANMIEQLADALNQALDALSKLQGHFESEVTSRSPASRLIDERKHALLTTHMEKVKRGRLASINKMQGEMRGWLEDPLFRTMALTMPKLDKWRTLAPIAAEYFRQAVNTTNARPGISDTGPTVRFVHELIPALIGERPARGNVAHHLKTCPPVELPELVPTGRNLGR
jgi:hypothetical protein